MILPTKHIPQHEALIGVGATLLRNLDVPRTVSGLWECVRAEPNVGTFERFILAADFLYFIGAVNFSNGQLVRASR